MNKEKQKKSKLWSYEDEYFNDESKKIELEHCKGGGENCKELLAFINNCYKEHYEFYKMKDYQRSVNTLEKAYMNSFDLRQPQCLKCAELFRNMMIESLEKIHEELLKQTTGFFKSKRHQANYELVDTVLNSLKKKVNSTEF